LEKEPERRYQSARELLVDLKNHQRDRRSSAVKATQAATPDRSRRRSLIALVATPLALFGLALYLLLPRAQPKGEAINSMAVLPFKPLVAESHDESLELGMADTLITRLSGIKQLIVRPVSAVRKYTSAEQSAVAAGKEQQVDAVLESHFQRSGDRIRVTARLVRVVDGSTVWAGKFDERFTDVFAVQDDISEQVVGALALQLTSAERKLLAKRGTENAEAYLLYQKGRFIQSKRTLEAFNKSAEFFNRAIEKDPNFALAYVGLADAYPSTAYGPPLNQDSILKRKTALKRALELDETLAEIHVTLANDFYGEWNLAESTREFQRALELNPNYAPAHQGYGRRNLLLMGRLDEALAHLKRAQELDPLSLIINSDIGTFYFFMGQYDRAIEQQRKTLEMDQNFYPAHRYLARALEMKGLLQEAIAEYQKAGQLNENPLLLANIGRIYAVSGKKAEALKILEQLKEISRKSYVSPYCFVIVYLGLGEKDQAFQWLERAYRERVLDLSHLTVDPYFAGLRSDPRFIDLVRRIGIAP
jgi:TolB-like protein/Tfp pilus assembly protein PilF